MDKCFEINFFGISNVEKFALFYICETDYTELKAVYIFISKFIFDRPSVRFSKIRVTTWPATLEPLIENF